MRSVWGWTPASSAATEITYTPRSRSFGTLTPPSAPGASRPRRPPTPRWPPVRRPRGWWARPPPRSPAGRRARPWRARGLHHHAPPLAPRARAAEGEEPLVVVEHTPPVALRAHDRTRSGRGAAAVAGVARHLAADIDRRRHAVHRVAERQVQLGLEVV